MSLQRVDYLKDLIEDARRVSDDPQIISAIILSDALNGVRKGLLDIGSSLDGLTIDEYAAHEIRDKVNRFLNCFERLSYLPLNFRED
jgi:hypothetical protein